jgi:hypothetical protein
MVFPRLEYNNTIILAVIRNFWYFQGFELHKYLKYILSIFLYISNIYRNSLVAIASQTQILAYRALEEVSLLEYVLHD